MPLTRVSDYFTKVLEDDLKAVVKPQYVDQLPKAIKGPINTVEPLLLAKSEMGNFDYIMDTLGTKTHSLLSEPWATTDKGKKS